MFDCRELGAIETTGAEPIRAWQLLGESIVASRFEALRGPALSPLIGRDEEIDLLSSGVVDRHCVRLRRELQPLSQIEPRRNPGAVASRKKSSAISRIGAASAATA